MKKRQENYGIESFSFKIDERVEANKNVHVIEEREKEISAKEVDVASVRGDHGNDYNDFKKM